MYSRRDMVCSELTSSAHVGSQIWETASRLHWFLSQPPCLLSRQSSTKKPPTSTSFIAELDTVEPTETELSTLPATAHPTTSALPSTRAQLCHGIVHTRLIADCTVEDEQQCPICMATYQAEDDLHELPCEHVFHVTCIVPWMEQVTILPGAVPYPPHDH